MLSLLAPAPISVREVLRGMLATIDRCKPVIMSEFYPENTAAIEEILCPFGYRSLPIRHTGQRLSSL